MSSCLGLLYGVDSKFSHTLVLLIKLSVGCVCISPCVVFSKGWSSEEMDPEARSSIVLTGHVPSRPSEVIDGTVGATRTGVIYPRYASICTVMFTVSYNKIQTTAWSLFSFMLYIISTSAYFKDASEISIFFQGHFSKIISSATIDYWLARPCLKRRTSEYISLKVKQLIIYVLSAILYSFEQMFERYVKQRATDEFGLNLRQICWRLVQNSAQSQF